MLMKPTGCTGCSLREKGKGFVPDLIVPSAEYVFVGEAPGKNEVIEAKPFVGRAGHVLFKWLLHAVPQLKLKYEQKKVSVCNTLRCVGYGTRVWMADGSWRQIQHIKNNEYVKCVVNGEIVTRPILAVTRSPNRKEWYQIDVDGAHRRNQHGNAGVFVTPDHMWLTPNGEIASRDLKVGSPVYLPQAGSDEFIHGTLLGDGHMRDDGIFVIAHANELYANEKAQHLGLVPRHKKYFNTFTHDMRDAWTVSCAIPRTWRSLFYRADRSKKWIAPPSDAALAIFYGDDGTLCSPKNLHPSASFATQSFVQDFDAVRSWFELQFGAARIDAHGNMRMGWKASFRMFERIASFMPPSMQYKLPPDFKGRYNGWLTKKPALVGTVLSVSPISATVDITKHSEMCLVVEEAHNFFTRCGLVRNCLPTETQGRAYPRGEEKTLAEAHCRQYDNFGAAHTIVLFGESPQRCWFKEELEAEDATDRQLGHAVKGVMGRVGRVMEKDGKRWVFAPHPAFILRQPALVSHGQQALRIACQSEEVATISYMDWDAAMREIA